MATLRRVVLLLAVLAAIAVGAYAGYTYRHNSNAVSDAAVVVVAPRVPVLATST